MKRRTHILFALLMLASLILYACVNTQIGVMSKGPTRSDGKDDLSLGPTLSIEDNRMDKDDETTPSEE